MLKQPTILEEVAYDEYRRRAEQLNLLAGVDKDPLRYAFARIVSAPAYASFNELLTDLIFAIENKWVRLLHVHGKSYSASQREFERRVEDPDYYRDLAQRAEEKQALTIELNLVSGLGESEVFRGNKLMFRRQEADGLIYLLKTYLHKEDFGFFGVGFNTEDAQKDFHGVIAVK
jgi:hypothetical protein